MSVTQLLAAGNMDARTAALCWLVLEAHGSILIAADPPHSGKTTTLTAFLDLVPSSVRRVYLRGGSETLDYADQCAPDETLLLANELSSHLPVYLWGARAVAVFRTLRDGFALAATMHADTPYDAIAQLRDELGVPADDLARIDLLVVMRVDGAAQGVARRVASVHRLRMPGPHVVALVERDATSGAWRHDDAAQLELVGSMPALEERAAYLARLVDQRVFGIEEVRAALAAHRTSAIDAAERPNLTSDRSSAKRRSPVTNDRPSTSGART